MDRKHGCYATSATALALVLTTVYTEGHTEDRSVLLWLLWALLSTDLYQAMTGTLTSSSITADMHARAWACRG